MATRTKAEEPMTRMDFKVSDQAKILARELLACAGAPDRITELKSTFVTEYCAKQQSVSAKSTADPISLVGLCIRNLMATCLLEANRHNLYPSFLDITQIIDRKKCYESFSKCVDIISLMVLRGVMRAHEGRDRRRALNDLFLSDILLSKVINVATKYLTKHQQEQLPSSDIDDLLYGLRTTIYFHIGCIYHDTYHQDEAYENFCTIIRTFESDKRLSVTSEGSLKPLTEGFKTGQGVELYRNALLRKAKLVIEYGRIAEATKWLLKAAAHSETALDTMQEDSKAQGRLGKYQQYINSILEDDVVDKEFITTQLSETVYMLFPDKLAIKKDLFLADVLIRLMYCVYILRPNSADASPLGKRDEWSSGVLTFKILSSLFQAAAVRIPKQIYGKAPQLEAILARNIMHIVDWVQTTSLKRRVLKTPKLCAARRTMEAYPANLLGKAHRRSSGKDLDIDVDFLNTLKRREVEDTDVLRKVASTLLTRSMLNKDSLAKRQKRIRANLLRAGKIATRVHRAVPGEGCQLYPTVSILRRYNSTSPLIPRPGADKVRGGGYFVVTSKGKGLVIDPGVDFLQNFYEDGFSIRDIDAVLLTHAHVDHTANFEAILTLLYEYNDLPENKDKKKKKKVILLLNIGTMHKMLPWASSQGGVIASIHSLCPSSTEEDPSATTTIDLSDKLGVIVDVFKAQHNEIISEKYSVGVILELVGKPHPWRFAITSDTGYFPGLADRIKDCNPIIVHLGDAYSHELLHYAFDGKRRQFRLAGSERALKIAKSVLVDKYEHIGQVYYHKNHLALAGLTKLIQEIAERIGPHERKDFIISEYPEEMGAYRLDVARVIQEVLRKKIKRGISVISGDIGLTVARKDTIPVYRCEICNLDNDLNECESAHGLAKYHPSTELYKTCIQNENERIAYRCERHRAKANKLWIQRSRFIHRKLV